MPTATEMKNSYLETLREAERELAGMDDRRSALLATIAGLKRLVGEGSQLPLGNLRGTESANGARPPVPPGFFRGKSPTQAYRDLMQTWPGSYSGKQVADAFQAGGMEGKTRTQLLASIHSVLKRERDKGAEGAG